MIGFTNISKVITNLNTGNSYGTEAYYTSIADSKNYFGEKKRLEFVYTSTKDLSGYNLYVNMALFMPNNAINPVSKKGSLYWECALPSAVVPGVYPANMNSIGTIFNFWSFKNFSVEIEIIDTTTFIVRADFYLTMDLLRYLDSFMSLENRDRFLKDRLTNPQDLTVSSSSIYGGADSDGRLYLYAEYAGDPSDYGSIETKFGGFTAEFVDAGDGEVSAVVYELDGQETDGPIVGKYTKVTMSVLSPDFTLEDAYVLVFKKNKIDNTVDFIENYSAETIHIFPYDADGNIIVGPYEEPTPDSILPDVYNFSFYINGNNISESEELSFIVMGYDSTGENGGSFYKAAGASKSGIEYGGQGFSMIGFLSDCQSSFGGNDLTCTIEERMASELIIQYPFDQYKNDIFNRLGLVINNNLTTFLQKIKFTIYEITSPPAPYVGSIVNVLDERVAYAVPGKYGISQYPGGNFDFSIIADQVNIKAYWRNRWEENVNCLYSLVNGVNYGTFLTNQDWGGKTLYVEWELTFFYDTLVTPFTDVVRHTQQITVKDYDSDLQIKMQDPTKEALNYQCSNANICMYAEYAHDPYLNYKLITLIDVDPGSILTVEENEVWTPDEFGALTSNKFVNQEENFDDSTGDQAKFCLNPDNLTDLVNYKVSAIAKQVDL